MDDEAKQLLIELKHEIDTRFAAIEKRLDTLEQLALARFNGLEQRLSYIEQQMGIEPALQY